MSRALKQITGNGRLVGGDREGRFQISKNAGGIGVVFSRRLLPVGLFAGAILLCIHLFQGKTINGMDESMDGLGWHRGGHAAAQVHEARYWRSALARSTLTTPFVTVHLVPVPVRRRAAWCLSWTVLGGVRSGPASGCQVRIRPPLLV